MGYPRLGMDSLTAVDLSPGHHMIQMTPDSEGVGQPIHRWVESITGLIKLQIISSKGRLEGCRHRMAPVGDPAA